MGDLESSIFIFGPRMHMALKLKISIRISQICVWIHTHEASRLLINAPGTATPVRTPKVCSPQRLPLITDHSPAYIHEQSLLDRSLSPQSYCQRDRRFLMIEHCTGMSVKSAVNCNKIINHRVGLLAYV